MAEHSDPVSGNKVPPTSLFTVGSPLAGLCPFSGVRFKNRALIRESLADSR